jgi:hypothetical protein
MSEDNDNKKLLKVLGLSLGLPSTVLATGLVVVKLIQENVISTTLGIIIILAVIFNIFWLIFRNIKK